MPKYEPTPAWRIYVSVDFGLTKCLGHYPTEPTAQKAVSKYYPSVPGVRVVREDDAYRCQGGHRPYQIRSNRKD
jgi:hypothetical protein